MIAYTLTAHSLFVAARICAITVFQILLFFAFHKNLRFLSSKFEIISKFKFSNVQNIISFVCGEYYRGRLREVQLNYVFVVQDVVSLGVLAVVNAGAPYSRELEFLG